MKPGHHCSYRQSSNVGDHAVTQLQQLAQHDHFPQGFGERLDQSVETP
jgi:hypothetical protein